MNFDRLEADSANLVADTFAERDESGAFAKARFACEHNEFEADYILTQHPTVQAVDFDGDDLSRAEQATIECPRQQFPVATLPEDCLIGLPGTGQWSIDKLRGTVFGPSWVRVYLSRKPRLKQTTRRMG